MPRHFTLEQAQALALQVEEQLRRALSMKSSLEDAVNVIEGESERIRLTGGALLDRGKVLEAAARRDAAVAQLRETLAAIQERGCLVKDLDVGLLDFPTLFRGEEVYLCWKLGEPAIQFWHGTDEGFRGRKPIDREFLEHHRGDA
jgi:hypothetical protein